MAKKASSKRKYGKLKLVFLLFFKEDTTISPKIISPFQAQMTNSKKNSLNNFVIHRASDKKTKKI